MTTKNNKKLVKKIPDWSKHWTTLVVVLSFITLLRIVYAGLSDQYKVIWILPLVYLILFLGIKNIRIYLKGNMGMWFINIIMLIRYVLIPFTLAGDSSSSYLYGPEPSIESYNLAIFLMVFELISIFVIIALFSTKMYKKEQITENLRNVKKSNWFLIMFSLLSIFILLQYPGMLIPNNLFIIKEIVYRPSLEIAYDGAIVLLSQISKLVLVLVLIQEIFKKFIKKNKANSIFYSITTLFIMLMYLGLMTGTQRWSIVIPALIFMNIIYEIYPKQFKLLGLIIGSIMIVMFLSSSTSKFMWNGDLSFGFYLDMFSDQLQIYFSGPRLVAQGIETVELYASKISMITLINDFGGSLPFFSKYFDQLNRINRYFNQYIFGNSHNTSQIIPMVSIGYGYFYVFLAPIFTSIGVYLAMLFDKKSKIARDIKYKYIYSYTAIWCAMSMGFNTQIVFSWFINLFILVILFKINDIVSLKK